MDKNKAIIEQYWNCLLYKSAFRRFKDTVRQLEIDDQWYEFRDAEYARKAMEWCIENNLEFEV